MRPRTIQPEVPAFGERARVAERPQRTESARSPQQTAALRVATTGVGTGTVGCDPMRGHRARAIATGSITANLARTVSWRRKAAHTRRAERFRLNAAPCNCRAATHPHARIETQLPGTWLNWRRARRRTSALFADNSAPNATVGRQSNRSDTDCRSTTWQGPRHRCTAAHARVLAPDLQPRQSCCHNALAAQTDTGHASGSSFGAPA
jgi:hypothetical protein